MSQKARTKLPEKERPSSKKPGRLFSVVKSAAISVGVTIALLLCIEGGLRLFGFSHKANPQKIFVPDVAMGMWADRFVVSPLALQKPDYYWLFVPDGVYVNSLGFFGKEVPVEKPKNSFRVATLGDSCTQGLINPFAERLERLLNTGSPSTRYEVVNAGIGSSSSHQGVLLYEKKVKPLRPDVLTVYFGWNDHWMSYNGLRHSQVHLPKPWQVDIIKKISPIRVFQLMQWLAGKAQSGPKAAVRVTQEEYRSNLTRIVENARKEGTEVILFTAPDGFDKHSPERLFWGDESLMLKPPGYKPSQAYEIINRVHGEYNEIVRSVAAQQQVGLLDLANILKPLDSERIFMSDGIHLTQAGHEIVAREILGALSAGGIVPRKDYEKTMEYWQSFEGLLRLGKLYLDERDCAEAIRVLTAAKELGSGNDDLQKLIDEAKRRLPISETMRQAVGNLYAGDLQKAATAYQAVIKADPSMSYAYSRLGWIYQVSGYPDQATIFFKTALELDPTNDDALYNFGAMLYQTSKSEEGRKVIEKLLSLYPKYPRLNMRPQ